MTVGIAPATSILATMALLAACAGDASPPTSTTSATSATSTSEPAKARSALEPSAWVACQCTNDADEIWLLHPDGSAEHQILADVGGRQRHPDFSHDGRRLAFDRLEKEAGMDEVWIAAADGTNPTRVTAPCSLDNCIGIWEPSWSPDDRLLAVITEGGPVVHDVLTTVAVEIIDLATNEMQSVVEQPGSDGQLHFPRWSPDGKQLVFWSETDQPTTWIVNVDGTGLRQLTPPALLAGDPDWSPDGTKLVVTTKPLVHFEDGPSDLFTIAPNGTGLTQLTDSASSGVRYTQPRWSPDGSAILYTRDVPGVSRTIWARTVDGSVDGAIAGTRQFQTHPVLQPNH
jgi:Tol biopolymer transport system component